MNESEKLARAAEKLANGKSGHSTTEKPGMLRHLSGRWRDPKVQAEIVALYTSAVEAEKAEGSKL